MSAARTITVSRTIPFPAQDVAAWMARPGAVERLAPPWLPLRFRSEAASLRDGEVDLAVLGAVRVTTRHDPEQFEEGRQFVDVVRLPDALPVPALRRIPGIGTAEVFRHLHRYDSAGSSSPSDPDRPAGTVLTDEITVPAAPGTRALRGSLERAASYRARQLSGDLDAHARATAIRERTGAPAHPLTIGMTGASGTIGTALAALLTTGGHRVVRLVRGRAQGPDERHWDPRSPAPDLAEGLDAIVHLAGAPISGRFTSTHKARIRDSRIGPTAALARVAGQVPFISASAIGYYGADRGDELLPETAAPGTDFLAGVVRGWETDAESARGRSVMVRTGIVQSAAGGALGLQHPLFAAGLGGRMGSGEQWLAWIALDDLLDVYYRAIVDDALEGPVNAVAPHPVRQREWATTMGEVLRRPTVLPTPLAGPQLLLGREGTQALALASQRVDAAALRSLGHTFRFPTLREALGHELGHSDRTVVVRA